MSGPQDERPSLKAFNASADRNGQDLGNDSPLDVGIAAQTQRDLRGEPNGEAETARIASGLPGEDATDQTAAETPPENLRRIGDAGFGAANANQSDDTGEAIERATAVVGSDEDDAS